MCKLWGSAWPHTSTRWRRVLNWLLLLQLLLRLLRVQAGYHLASAPANSQQEADVCGAYTKVGAAAAKPVESSANWLIGSLSSDIMPEPHVLHFSTSASVVRLHSGKYSPGLF